MISGFPQSPGHTVEAWYISKGGNKTGKAIHVNLYIYMELSDKDWMRNTFFWGVKVCNTALK